MLKGSIVAIVTPMQSNLEIDYVSLRKLVNWQISEGTKGVVAVGTTGESPTLSFHEHCEVIEKVVSFVDGRVPVIAGSGANSTSEAIELTKFSKSVGVMSCLSVVPYYNKPTQQGLIKHFYQIADSTDIPQIIYNVPGRTITDISDEAIIKLSKHSNISGIKDATGDLSRIVNISRSLPSDFALYSGDDFSALPYIFLGGHGVISVTANIVPRIFNEMCELALSGELEKANLINRNIYELNKILFSEANPIPVKWMLSIMNKIQLGIRSPLTCLSTDKQLQAEKVLKEMKII